MSDRKNFFQGQLVGAPDLNAAFNGLEVADRNIVADSGLFGMIAAGVVVQHSPTANLTVDISGGAVGYDQQGERLAWPTTQTVDVSQDFGSVSTAVAGAGNQKWVSVFVQFLRILSDPRIVPADSSTIYFDQAEGVTFYVTQGAEATIGTAARPALQGSKVLLADIDMRHSETQVLNASIDITRRQDQIVLPGGPFSVRRGKVGDALADLLAAINSVAGGGVSGISTANVAGAALTEATFTIGAGTLAAQLPALALIVDGDRGAANNVGIARVQQFSSLANMRATLAPASGNGIALLTPSANGSSWVSDSNTGFTSQAVVGGIYYWDSLSTLVDEGFTVIKVAGVATGRWRLARAPAAIMFESHFCDPTTFICSTTGGGPAVKINTYGFSFLSPRDFVLGDIVELTIVATARIAFATASSGYNDGTMTIQFRKNGSVDGPVFTTEAICPVDPTFTIAPQANMTATYTYVVQAADVTAGTLAFDAVYQTVGGNGNVAVLAQRCKIIRP